MINTYSYILYNLPALSNDLLNDLLFKLELEVLACVLKTKFNDDRSISVLKDIIVEEYTLDILL